MNSRQRRRAYRAMPKPGTMVKWLSSSSTFEVTAIVEMRKEWHHGQFFEERLNVPCVHRIRVVMVTGCHFHPLVRKLRIVK